MIKKYTKNRQRLVSLIGATKSIITISDAEVVLNLSRDEARRLLWSMTKAGWIKAISPGVYTPVPLEASDPTLSGENPLILANHFFSACYIGGWTAANFWGLTDQIFLNTWVMTIKNVRHKEKNIGEHPFILTQIDAHYLYGYKLEWLENNQIKISDPSKTVIDFLNFPRSFSANAMLDIFGTYINSQYRDLKLLQNYATDTGNKSIFKRLGFLTEKYMPSEIDLINFCSHNISKGYSALSSISDCDSMITKWNLRVPSSLAKRVND